MKPFGKNQFKKKGKEKEDIRKRKGKKNKKNQFRYHN